MIRNLVNKTLFSSLRTSSLINRIPSNRCYGEENLN